MSSRALRCSTPSPGSRAAELTTVTLAPPARSAAAIAKRNMTEKMRGIGVPSFCYAACGEAPGAEAAHGQAGEVDAFLVGLVLLLDLGQDRHGAFAIVAGRAPALGLGLGEDGDELELLFDVADVLGEAALDLLLTVVAR